MRCAVVGHVEWVEFARVPDWPEAGAIIHATDVWSEPAGGGAVVARESGEADTTSGERNFMPRYVVLRSIMIFSSRG